MPDPVVPQINPPLDSEGNNLGGIWGKQDRPWWVGFFQALYVGGQRVATVVSPVFVGTPKASTPDANDDSTRIATTEWVRDYAPAASSTGDVDGPASSADGDPVLFDGTTGKAIKVGTATGTGAAVRASTPTLVTPVLGVASATSVNKVAITAPATSATLTLANGSTLATAGAYGVTLTATGTTGVTLPTSGTLGVLNADTALDTGNANACTAADLRAHLDNVTKHRLINDSGTSSTELWSASKINTELGTITSSVTSSLSRTNHTGSQTASTISDFNTSVDARVSSVLGSTYLKADGTVAGTGRQEVKLLNFTDWASISITSGSTAAISTTLVTLSSETGTTDTLDTISVTSAAVGDELRLRAASTHTITLSHGTGNIYCSGGTSFTLSGNEIAFAIKDSTYWYVGKLTGAVTAATGDVVGPASATTSVPALFDGTTGKLLKNSTPTGTGNPVMQTSPTINTPTFTAPVLGTPGSGTLTNCTGLPTAGIVDAAVTLAKMANVTQGDLISRTTAGSGVPQIIGIGSSGQVLEVASGIPSWAFAYREVWIGAGSIIPRTTNGPAQATIETTTNDVMFDLLDFDASTEEGATFCVSLPNRYGQGTVKAKFYWTAAAGSSGNVIWGIRGRANGDDDALDSAYGTEVTVTDAWIAGVDLHVSSATTAITISNTPATDDLLVFQVVRKAADGSDTFATDARLIGVKLQYLEGAASAAW